MTVFLTFGDAAYEPALQRIEAEARASGFFDRIAIRRPQDLGKDFWRNYGSFVASNRRGYGCWLWKPWLIRRELAACEADEVLVYADAGCTINKGGLSRLEAYCRLLQESPAGVLGFTMQHPEKAFTKGDAFGALDAWSLKDTPQVMATIILWRRCAESMAIAEEWLALAETLTLISDAPSAAPNDPAFVEHRHDQSLFSLLAKLRGATLIPDETATGGGDASAAPFSSARRRGGRSGPLRGLRRDIRVGLQRVRHALHVS